MVLAGRRRAGCFCNWGRATTYAVMIFSRGSGGRPTVSCLWCDRRSVHAYHNGTENKRPCFETCGSDMAPNSPKWSIYLAIFKCISVNCQTCRSSRILLTSCQRCPEVNRATRVCPGWKPASLHSEISSIMVKDSHGAGTSIKDFILNHKINVCCLFKTKKNALINEKPGSIS